MKIKLFIILSIVIFPLGIANHSTAIAQHSIKIAQPRQTPTANPAAETESQTPTETEQNIDPEQAEAELDQVVPKTQQNPFTKPDIDKLLTNQFNDDMWRIMRGGLPCLETTSSCLEQLQNKSVADSPLLKELDTRIQEATSKIDEARAKNAKTVKLSILTPALQYLLGPTPTAGKPQEGNGLIDNLWIFGTCYAKLLNKMPV